MTPWSMSFAQINLCSTHPLTQGGRGLEGARQLARAVVEHPDYINSHSKIDDILAVDDKVVLRYTVIGTYVGEEKPGYPKKGERFASGTIAIYRFVDGKIADDWVSKNWAPRLPLGDKAL
jgi:hypothetical protein